MLVDTEPKPLTERELNDTIVRLLAELGMTRYEFLRRVSAGTEPDTFAAMALKGLLAA